MCGVEVRYLSILSVSNDILPTLSYSSFLNYCLKFQDLLRCQLRCFLLLFLCASQHSSAVIYVWIESVQSTYLWCVCVCVHKYMLSFILVSCYTLNLYIYICLVSVSLCLVHLAHFTYFKQPDPTGYSVRNLEFPDKYVTVFCSQNFTH